ncbi:MAG: NAD kinase [Culturomica sp.]|jgi:NAD+ kinase|nr:NAD kinase [Culturomica sp.]
MRTIALYGRTIEEGAFPSINQLLSGLKSRSVKLLCEQSFYQSLTQKYGCTGMFDDVFTLADFKQKGAELLLSVGGDGTFLHAVHYVCNTSIPLLGMNIGRLGFLADFSTDEIETAVDLLAGDNYKMEKRSLLNVKLHGGDMEGYHYAMNEVSVQKTDTSSLINIYSYVDSEYLTNYWADGLIVATPTGSTAYSLSSGGPIISPSCRCILLTPLCAHNLGVRALVVPSATNVRLKIMSRSRDFLLSLDSQTYILSDKIEVEIFYGASEINMLHFPNHSFYKTLREKLHWGEDKRNDNFYVL